MRPVGLHRYAARYLRRMPGPQRERMRVALEELAGVDDVAEHRNVRLMRGQWAGCYRLRVGECRAVFRLVNDREEMIEVLNIGPRGDVY